MPRFQSKPGETAFGGGGAGGLALIAIFVVIGILNWFGAFPTSAGDPMLVVPSAENAEEFFRTTGTVPTGYRVVQGQNLQYHIERYKPF
jgi:hypothetical protein